MSMPRPPCSWRPPTRTGRTPTTASRRCSSDCVKTLFEEIGLDIADGEATEDEDEHGEPFETSEDDRSLAASIFPIEVADGDTRGQVRLIEMPRRRGQRPDRRLHHLQRYRRPLRCQ